MSEKDCDLLYVSTTSGDHYPKKSVLHVPSKYHIAPSEFRDPICEAFRGFLKSDDSLTGEEENAEKYYDKIKDKHDGVKKHFAGEFIDYSYLHQSKVEKGKTTYQCHFCNIEKDTRDKELQLGTRVVLPMDIYIPLTTQKLWFRDPIKLNSRAYERRQLIIPPQSLRPDEKIRKILNVTTGHSEVMNQIGALGKIILDEEMHGVINRN